MAVSDFRVYDATEGWVSMGDVASGKVVLPVPSADGTVVLDSPAASTFTIETGGTERLRVNSSGNSWFKGNVGIKTGTGDPAFALSVNGQVASASGFSSAPAYTFHTDPDTGVFSPATNTWAVATHGLERFRVDSDGTVEVRGEYATKVPARLLLGFNYAISSTQNLGSIDWSDGTHIYAQIAQETTSGTGLGGSGSLLLSTRDGTALKERMRLTDTGDLLAATGYTPATDQSLATKAYVDANSAASTTTRSVRLTNPTRAAGRLIPPAGLKTQEDANIFFGNEIAKRSPVVVCTQVEYDGITPDPETLYIING